MHMILYSGLNSENRFPEVHESETAPAAWVHAVQDKFRECEIATWMEHRGLIEKNVKELERLYRDRLQVEVADSDDDI